MSSNPACQPRYDHKEALRLIAQGVSLTDVGKKFGVTREAVRQLAAKHGVVALTGWAAKRIQREQVPELVLSGMSDAAIASELGASITLVLSARNKAGLSECGIRERQAAEVEALAREGYTFRQIGIRLGIEGQTAHDRVRHLGLPNLGSKWRDFSHRKPLAVKVRAAGGTWAEVAAAWSEVEGFENAPAVAHNWVRNNAPELIVKGRPYRTPKRGAVALALSAQVSA